MDWNNVTCVKCGSINDYTIKEVSGQQVCNCGCGHFLGNKPREYEYRLIRMPFGKYKDNLICDIEDLNYLKWAYENIKINGNVLKAIKFKIGVQ